jgi:hypothetical protein
LRCRRVELWGLWSWRSWRMPPWAAPFFAGLAETGGKAAERFKTLGERYERWRVDEKVINEVINAPLRGERPYEALLKLAESGICPSPSWS